MKKIFTAVLCLLTMTSAWADDGGSYFPDKWTYGNIYVKETNPCIALDKEYMEVKGTDAGDHIKAVFAFRNTTDSTVVVPCAFPVVIKQTYWIEGDSIYFRYNDIIDMPLCRMFFNSDIKLLYSDDAAAFHLPMTVSEVQEYDQKLRVMKYSDYEELYPTSEIDHYGERAKRHYYGCNIEQDEATVELKNVGIETNVEIDGKECKFTMVLHFYHELMFKPYETSKVVVEYDVNSYFGCYDCRDYMFDYDISTGGTWKDGEIGEFVLVTDSRMYHDDGNRLQYDDLLGYNIFSAQHYKPKGYFHFKKDDGYIYNDDFPRSASEDKRHKLYLTGVGQNGAFDVDEDETLSFEPTLVNGKIVFELNKPCYGPFIANGYVDKDIAYKNGCIFDNADLGREGYEYSSPFMRDSLWSTYSRAKKMTLTCMDQDEQHGLLLDDRFPAYPYTVSTQKNDGWYAANSSQWAYILRPGKYELSIDDIYRGEVSDTVGLSRIWFYPVSQSLIDMLDADSKSDMVLFDELPRVIRSIIRSYETHPFDDNSAKDDSDDEASESELSSDDDVSESALSSDTGSSETDSYSIWLYIGILTGIIAGIVIFLLTKRKSRI